MKILNWNTCAFSRKQNQVIEKALQFESDVITLQEVTVRSLEKLKDLPDYYISYTNDSESEKGGCYLVTLSKFPILSEGVVEYFDKEIRSPFARIRDLFSRESEHHKSLYVDIKYGDETIRLYNIHISWPVTPSIRVEQFSNFSERIKDQIDRSIVCGDLNVFGHLKYYNILTSLLFGYKLKDISFNERGWFDKKFEELGLQNPFKGTVSWPFLPLNAQLDHILVPQHARIVDKYHTKDTYGSDHTPYLLEIEI